MDVNKKRILYIVVAVALVLGVLYFLQTKTPQNTADSENATTTAQESSQSESATIAETVSNEPPSENPGDLKDIVDQPAYLISAYTDHGKNVIGVDYTLLFTGQEAIDAQVEDGVCANATECQVSPNGYIRNVNPHFRTIEIATTTPLVVEASGAILSALASKGIQNSTPSFDVLKETVTTMPAYASSSFPFKEAKTFVHLTIKNGAVTKIVEPYRE